MASLMSSNLFRGQLVRLAAPHPDDKEIMARWHNDPEFLRHLDTDPARPRPANYFDADHDKSKERREFEFRIRTLTDDKLVGFTDLSVIWNHQHAWIAIGIGEAEH
jgi:RimJ/RimL family protein N-acetyltransferase